MTTPTVFPPMLPATVEQPEFQRRIDEVQTWLEQLGRRNPEDASILATDRARGNVAQIRTLFLELAPILKHVRDNQLFRYHPEGFSTFEEWLAQPEIDLALSKATDMINFWDMVVPVAVQAGIDVDEMARQIGDSKLRLLVPIIKGARKQQKRLVSAGMSQEQAEVEVPIDIVELTHMAKELTWRDLREQLRPAGHDPELELQLITEPAGDGYWHFRTQEPVDEETLQIVDRKLRPRWFDNRGRFRPIREG